MHLAVKIQAIISVIATSLTQGYVLNVVAMHTESIIYSRQHYFNYSLTTLCLRVVYCRFCKARLAHTHSEKVSRSFAFDL